MCSQHRYDRFAGEYRLDNSLTFIIYVFQLGQLGIGSFVQGGVPNLRSMWILDISTIPPQNAPRRQKQSPREN